MTSDSPVHCETWESDGVSIRSVDKVFPSIKYDFIMTTVVLEHIPLWSIRYSIFCSIFEALKSGGIFSCSVQNLPDSVRYYEESQLYPKNALVNEKEYLLSDLFSVGFVDLECYEHISGKDSKPRWLFVKGRKQ